MHPCNSVVTRCAISHWAVTQWDDNVKLDTATSPSRGLEASFDRWVPPPRKNLPVWDAPQNPWALENVFFTAWKNMASILAIYLFVKFQGTEVGICLWWSWEIIFWRNKNIHLNLESGKQLPKQLNTNFSYLERWKGSLSQKYLWHLLCPWQWWPFEKDANSARTSWSYLVFF